MFGIDRDYGICTHLGTCSHHRIEVGKDVWSKVIISCWTEFGPAVKSVIVSCPKFALNTEGVISTGTC